MDVITISLNYRYLFRLFFYTFQIYIYFCLFIVLLLNFWLIFFFVPVRHPQNRRFPLRCLCWHWHLFRLIDGTQFAFHFNTYQRMGVLGARLDWYGLELFCQVCYFIKTHVKCTFSFHTLNVSMFDLMTLVICDSVSLVLVLLNFFDSISFSNNQNSIIITIR